MSAEVNAVLVEQLATGPQKPINECSRFGRLALGALCCMCTSLSYAFNLISKNLEDRYSLNGRDITTISTVGLVVSYFVLPYAFVYDHFGPRPILFLATILFPLGALLLALCFAGKIEGDVVRLSVFNAIMSLGCVLFDLGSVVTVMSLFPSNRGAVVASMKVFTGLGSAIVGSIRLAFFKTQTENFFYFLMALAFVTGVVALVFMRLPSYHLTGYEQNHLSDEDKERRLARKAVYLRQKPPMIRFVIGFVILIILIVFLPLQSALLAYQSLGPRYELGFAVVVIVLTLLYPVIAMPLPACLTGREEEEEIDGSGSEPAAKAPEDGATNDPVRDLETDVDYIAPQYQGTFLQNLLTLRLWALLWSFFCVVGAEFVIIFNAQFILAALSGEKVSVELSTLLTVLNGVGSAVGRLLMSGFEVWSQKRKAEDRIPITVSLFIPTLLIILAMVLFLVLPKAALPLPYAVAALGNGFCAAVAILVTRTIFAKDPAKHYNFCFVGTALSAIFLNRLLYGEWYAREQERRVDGKCYDKACVLVPLVALTGFAASALLSNLYLHLQYRSYCLKTLEERRRLREEELQQEPIEDGVIGGTGLRGINAHDGTSRDV